MLEIELEIELEIVLKALSKHFQTCLSTFCVCKCLMLHALQSMLVFMLEAPAEVLDPMPEFIPQCTCNW